MNATTEDDSTSKEKKSLQIDRAIASVERAIDKLIMCLALEDETHRVVSTLLGLGEVGLERLSVVLFRVKDPIARYYVIRVLSAIALNDGAAVIEPLRRLIAEDLDPMTTVVARTAFGRALMSMAEARRAARASSGADTPAS